MFCHYSPDLPLLFSKDNAFFDNLIHTPAILSSMSGGNNGGFRQPSFQPVASVAEALEIARDSEEGAQDPTVRQVLETAITAIWVKVEAQPTSYVMNREEFAVFNYFQHRFQGHQLATAARKRYWDSLETTNGVNGA